MAKGSGQSRTGHTSSEREKKYSYTLSLTSVLNRTNGQGHHCTISPKEVKTLRTVEQYFAPHVKSVVADRLMYSEYLKDKNYAELEELN